MTDKGKKVTHMKSACTSALSSPKQTPSAPVTGFVVGGKYKVCSVRSSDSERRGSSSILAVHGNSSYQAWWAGCLGITAEQGLQDREWGKVVDAAGNTCIDSREREREREQRAKSKEQRARSEFKKKPFHL